MTKKIYRIKTKFVFVVFFCLFFWGRLLQMKQRIVIVGLYSRVSVAAQLGQSRRLSC